MWPNYFPDNCPVGAKGRDAKVYRLIDNNPPTEVDFLPNYITQPKRTFRNVCQACGLSIFEDESDAIKQNELLAQSAYFIRKGLTKKRLALGRTDSECGVVKATPQLGEPDSTHLTYWIFEDTSVKNHFKVI